MTASYAAWDSHTEDYLRHEADDTYVRPIFSILDDDENEHNDHRACSICQTEDSGARWVPDNGGAWVISSYWKESQYAADRYSKYNL